MISAPEIVRQLVDEQDAAALERSGGINPDWYRTAYPDVAMSGLEPAEHYLWIGSRLGRSPLPPVGSDLTDGSTRADHRNFAPLPAHDNLMTLAQRGMPRPPFDLDTERAIHYDIKDERFWSLADHVHEYTELHTEALFNLYTATRYIIEEGIEGDIIECGVHLGGSVMLMEYLLLEDAAKRRLFALDTFTGFVRRSDEYDVNLRTGEAACPVEDNSDDYTAPSTENMESVGFKGLRVVKGDVLETIPKLDVKRIALLRLDTDTYDTTKFELEELYEKVSPGGVIIVDDYGYTVGCKKAVDDFIADKMVLLQRVNPNVRSWVKLSGKTTDPQKRRRPGKRRSAENRQARGKAARGEELNPTRPKMT